MSKSILYLKRAYILMRKALDERLSAHHLTTSQFEIMGYLYATPELDQQQLQQCSGVTSATLTGILDKLEQRGYLLRKLSSADGRAKVVVLTPEGRNLVAQCIDLFHEFEHDMLNGFSPAERAILTDWLQKIALNLGYRDDGSCV